MNKNRDKQKKKQNKNQCWNANESSHFGREREKIPVMNIA